MEQTKVEALDVRAMRIAKLHSRCETELISIFQELSKTKGYLHFGLNSLFDYCVRRLKLSEATAYNLIAVARKAVEVPELKKAVEAGEISIWKARKIAPVINIENKAVWIDIAKKSSTRELEKAVASEKPELLIKETVQYKASDRIEFRTGISEKLLKKLERIKDLESQRTSSAVNFEAALDAMADVYLEKFDPIQRAERCLKRAEKRKAERVQPVARQVLGASASRTPNKKITVKYVREVVPAAAKHAVTLRDLRRCTHIYSDGSRCECTRWLDVHHIVPIAMGGTNEISNLTTMCRTHHQMLHQH